nr:MAG TPA: hypothetical protein [Caudoviricetes sp.]
MFLGGYHSKSQKDSERNRGWLRPNFGHCDSCPRRHHQSIKHHLTGARVLSGRMA